MDILTLIMASKLGRSNGGSVVDKTLTVDGAAADAKVVGEKVSQLYEEIADQSEVIDGKQPKGDYALKSEIPAPYTLPTASDMVKGGVMVGDDFVMDGETLKAKPENKYELISEVAYKEGSGVAMATFDTMPNGEPFLFRAVRITGSIDDIDIVKQRTVGYSAYSGTKGISGNVNTAISSKNCTGAALFEVKHGMMTMEVSLWSSEDWIATNVYWQPRAVYVDDGMITKITIRPIGIGDVLDGYAFKIEGVRA